MEHRKDDGRKETQIEITPNFLKDRSKNLSQDFAIHATAYGHRVTLQGEK